MATYPHSIDGELLGMACRQDAMGWQDCHLHAFFVDQAGSDHPVSIGIPDDEASAGIPDTLAGWDESVSEWLTPGTSVRYIYDFGDSWEHDVTLDAVKITESAQQYPQCVDGARACPPEDIGGIPGYEMLCAGNPDAQDDIDFAPDAFDRRAVVFTDPHKRLQQLTG